MRLSRALGLAANAVARQPPYPPPFPTSELCVIELALERAWTRVVERLNVLGEGEVEITAALVQELDVLMNAAEEPVPGFSGATFETIVRGGELESYDGVRLEKRPDIVFRRVGRADGFRKQLWGLFVECKVVDSAHPVAKYCHEGIRRFSDGRYAWAVSTAMMIAYARSGFVPEKNLGRCIQKTKTSYGLLAGSFRQRAEGRPHIWVSDHDRPWQYVAPFSGVPGSISLTHIWLYP